MIDVALYGDNYHNSGRPKWLHAALEKDLWHKIRMDAANDPELKAMFDEILTFWNLKYGLNKKN